MRFLSFLLLAAASEAKKEALAKKYSLDPMIVNQIANSDPTPNGEFCEWMAREASKNQLPMGTGLPNVIAMLNEFIKIKRNPEWKGDKNILNYTAEKFLEVMEVASREDYSKKQKVRDIEENAKKYLADGVKYLGKTNGCYAYQVLTPVASAAMSKGTHWCTQSEDTSHSYLSDGCIFVFTKPGFMNSYKNDKYAQIYISSDRLEAETCEGKDLTSNNKFGLVYTEECMEFIKFLAQFNDAIKKGVDSGDIHMKEENDETCISCGDVIEEGEAHEGDGDLYCENCYYDHYTSCEACGDTINTDDGDYVSSDNGTYCNDCGQYCQSCDNGFRTTGRNAVQFHEVTNARGHESSICDNCFHEDYFNCEECDENHSNDEGYEIDDERVCEDCFKTKWKEDVMESLVAWAETDGNDEKIRKAVLAQAESEFAKHKEYLVGAEFKAMQDHGYLFAWDDLDLATTVTHLSEAQKQQDKWKNLVAAVQDPIHFACEVLADEAQINANPTEGWSSDEVLEWTHDNGASDSDDNFTGYQFF